MPDHGFHLAAQMHCVLFRQRKVIGRGQFTLITVDHHIRLIGDSAAKAIAVALGFYLLVLATHLRHAPQLQLFCKMAGDQMVRLRWA